MKLLIVVSRFFMGGFTKSLLNFLLCADKYSELNIDVLCLEKNEFELRDVIPKRFGIIELGGLSLQEDTVKKGLNFRYIFNKKRLQSLEYVIREIYHKKLRHQDLPKEMVVKFTQHSIEDIVSRVTNDFSFAKDYDCVISWEENLCNYLLAEKIPAKHKIAYIHPNYTEVGFCKGIDRKYLQKMDRIVTISQSCYDTLCSVFPNDQDKIVYIPNRLCVSYLQSQAQEYAVEMDPSCVNFLTVARIFDHDKAVFRIVSLSRRLAKEGYRFHWNVVGNGSDFEALQQKVAENQLQEYITLVGEKQNPCPYMKSADLMVMQSYREGRPVAVDEAIVLGTPALITDYSSAYEQIEQGVTGLVVENEEDAIYRGLKKILDDPSLLQTYKNNIIAKDHAEMFEDCNEMIRVLEEVLTK